MSSKKRREESEPIPFASTLDIDGFQSVSDGQPEEFDLPEDGYEYEEENGSSLAERLLYAATIVLSVLLTAGSAVFWWYFVRRLTICPASVNNREIYPVMLTACALIALAVTIAQVMRRRSYPSPESWMVNICVSGAISAVLMTVYNTVVLDNVFEWGDVLPTLCFTVSGCALPAAIFALVWALIMILIDHIRYENSRNRDAVYASVIAQCEGRFR